MTKPKAREPGDILKSILKTFDGKTVRGMTTTQKLIALKSLSKGRVPKRQRLSTEKEIEAAMAQFTPVNIDLARMSWPVAEGGTDES